MYYIEARPITTDHLLVAPPEDPTAAWASGTTYAVGDERHLPATHRVYTCVTAGPSATSPDKDPANWVDTRPTNRWAPFDLYTQLTKAVSTDGDLVYEIASRFSPAIILDGLEGEGVLVEVLDAPGGAVVYRYPATGDMRLVAGAGGYWDYVYGQRTTITQLLLTNLPMLASAVIRITVRATGSARRAIGLINRGALRQIHGASFGGVLRDASATPITYTYRPKRADGTFGPTQLRPGAKQRQWQVIVEDSRADEALRVMDALSNTPAYVIATLAPGFNGLRGFGLVTRGEVIYAKPISKVNVTLEDIV